MAGTDSITAQKLPGGHLSVREVLHLLCGRHRHVVGEGKGLRGASAVQIVARLSAAACEPFDKGGTVIVGGVVEEGIGVCDPLLAEEGVGSRTVQAVDVEVVGSVGCAARDEVVHQHDDGRDIGVILHG